MLKGCRSWQGHFLRLADATALDLPRFVCGANTKDQHCWGRTWDAMPAQIRADLRTAQAGDQCVHDPSQTLSECRGIEVGHIFQLGRKYSEALDARFTNSSGQQEALLMGCYGIGITKLPKQLWNNITTMPASPGLRGSPRSGDPCDRHVRIPLRSPGEKCSTSRS